MRDIKSLISNTVILDEKIIKELSSSIASEVANKIYYEFLLARYIPEIELIKKGKIKALKGDKLREYIRKRIKSLK